MKSYLGLEIKCSNCMKHFAFFKEKDIPMKNENGNWICESCGEETEADWFDCSDNIIEVDDSVLFKHRTTGEACIGVIRRFECHSIVIEHAGSFQKRTYEEVLKCEPMEV